MKYSSLLLITIALFSCKKETTISPPSLIGSTWHLVESRENLNLTMPISSFTWKSFKRQSSGDITYQFSTDSVIEKDYPCDLCYRGLITRKAKYSKVDEDFKIQVEPDKESLIIYGNSSNSIVKLTNDTLIIGKNKIGREGDYSEFKLVRLK
ncbi:hypothetical protein VB796_04480 [Arcicella sp. LKC2W]|uniref:hypothetical protein n=1 Tax=Arcicella sp. LKC2W TaxID=2984198 RepID=UPI002B1F7ABE|nr:hypothetical protein [Arcicella sp. LKC2W]MEA5458278.1 hypothetical protein [Arcicella sp. LKC2W]